MRTSKPMFCVVILLVLFNFFVPSQCVWAWGDRGIPQRDLDGTFGHLYPKPFLQTTIGKVAAVGGSAILVGTITYFTAGVGAGSAGPIATWVGTMIGSAKGLAGIAATNYGLALLGGGSIASGGLGILGGVTVLNVIGDVAIAVALDGAVEKIPSDNTSHDFLNLLKIKMFKDGFDPAAEDLSEKLEDVLDEQDSVYGAKGLIKDIKSVLERSLQGPTRKNRGYDYLLLSIIEFNENEFAEAKKHLSNARIFFEESSFLEYLEGLLHLVDGKDDLAEKALREAIQQEPEAIPPYVVLAQMYHDNGATGKACSVLKRGLKDADDESFSLNWMLGNFLYEDDFYTEAVEYYKEALSEVSVNETEAVCKLNIAMCFKKMGNAKESKKWLEKALDEAKDNLKLAKDIKVQYYGRW